mmetsp:Transcript_10488/g.23472  ORF Transcript_10488/g.23472 Transcript_10488/m.23472 type:complete len:271 (-) Transcript_10488:2-814(-)
MAHCPLSTPASPSPPPLRDRSCPPLISWLWGAVLCSQHERPGSFQPPLLAQLGGGEDGGHGDHLHRQGGGRCGHRHGRGDRHGQGQGRGHGGGGQSHGQRGHGVGGLQTTRCWKHCAVGGPDGVHEVLELAALHHMEGDVGADQERHQGVSNLAGGLLRQRIDTLRRALALSLHRRRERQRLAIGAALRGIGGMDLRDNGQGIFRLLLTVSQVRELAEVVGIVEGVLAVHAAVLVLHDDVAAIDERLLLVCVFDDHHERERERERVSINE